MVEAAKPGQLGTPQFNIIFYDQDLSGKFVDYADTAALMANYLNNNAIFQFAGNSNARDEGGGGQAVPVQNATRPGAAYRGQNFVKIYPDSSEIQDGYVKEKIPASLNTDGDNAKNIDNIWIGIHKNIQTCFDGKNFFHENLAIKRI